MIKLILVRHAQTAWNKISRHQGNIDIPISREGIKQAKKVAKRLKNIKTDLIITSRKKRAVKTAEIINKHHNVPLKKYKVFNEIKVGILEGLTLRQAKKKYKGLYKEMEKDIYNFRFPKAESYSDVEKRVMKKLKEILKKNKGKTILFVTHGGVKRVVLKVFLKKPLEKIKREYLDNTSLTELIINKGKVRVLRIGCTKHL